MAWFQVNCPTCTAALQVWLDAGTKTVECSAPTLATGAHCAALFDVHVPQCFLPEPTAPPERRRLVDLKPRSLTAYNKFMAAEVKRVKLTLTTLTGRERQRAAFRIAATNWESSSLNPKNAAATVGGAADGTMNDAADGL